MVASRTRFNAAPNPIRLVDDALRDARTPAEVFGPDPTQAKHVFHNLSKFVHPDSDNGKVHPHSAQAAFVRLRALWGEAEIQIQAKTYGLPMTNPISGDAPTAVVEGIEYSLGSRLGTGDLADVFEGRNLVNASAVVFKVCRDPRNNDLMENEAAALSLIAQTEGYSEGRRFLPALISTFMMNDLRVNVLKYHETYMPAPSRIYSLARIAYHFDNALDAKALGWLWRRLLGACVTPHEAGVIHASIVPDNIMIDPASHGAVLIDWCHASIGQSVITSLSLPWQNFYPLEITDKEPPLPSLDIYMAARCMLWASRKGKLPEPMMDYFSICTWVTPQGRPDKVKLLIDMWDDLLFNRLRWPREFIELPFDPNDVAVDFSWWWS